MYTISYYLQSVKIWYEKIYGQLIGNFQENIAPY
jgi:hypothetical protein